MREICKSGSMRGRRKRAATHRACVLLYFCPAAELRLGVSRRVQLWKPGRSPAAERKLCPTISQPVMVCQRATVGAFAAHPYALKSCVVRPQILRISGPEKVRLVYGPAMTLMLAGALGTPLTVTTTG